MRFFLFLITPLLFFTHESYSRNYYFSSSTGNDSYTETQAQNPSTPWRSIDCLNKSMNLFGPGDSILFKRGDIFTGQIAVTVSGTSTGRIVFGTYGIGKEPVITGTVTITSWNNIGGNIWEANLPQADATVSNFLINGHSQQIGRFPNENDPNKGYLNIESHNGQLEIVNSSLSSSYNWTGAEAIVRIRRWKHDRVSIQTHQGNALSFGNPTSFEILDKFGFFIQNHINTLDQNGEWYYDGINKKVFLFHSADPNSMITEASIFLSVFEAVGKQYISIENIEFKGSIRSNIVISSSNNIDIKNNIFSEAGCNAVNFTECNKITFSNNEIIHANNNALVVLNCRSFLIRNNKIHRIGLRSGMTEVKTGVQYTGAFLVGNNIQFESNTLDSIGYNGIYFIGDTITVINNLITNFCINLDDGAGLYTASDGKTENHDRIIENNIILNGIGTGAGTDYPDLRHAEGIYIDDRSDHVKILGNSVANCSDFGIYVHNSNHLSIFNNTVFNNHNQIVFINNLDAPEFLISSCDVRNNIFFAKSISQHVAEYRTMHDDIAQFGTFNNNYYCKPVKDDRNISLTYSGSAGIVSKLIDLKTWQNTFNHDRNSFTSPYKIPGYSLLNFIDSDQFINGTFETDISGWGCWSNYNNCNSSWDNSGNLDNGCLKLSFKESSGNPDGYLAGVGSCGEVIAGENYILRFSMVSSHPDKKVRISMRNGNSPYNEIAIEQHILVNTNRKEYELLFTPNSSVTNASIHLDIEEDNESYWIDNVELYHANIQITSTEESIRFFYNPGNSAITINDGNFYVDPKGNVYHNFALQPFSSLILLKVTKEYFDSHPGLIKISSISVSSHNGENNITTPNGSLQLTANIVPDNATSKTVTWSIQNGTGQASINASGLVTAIASGTVTATATATDGSGVSGSLLITISDEKVMITTILVYGTDLKSVIPSPGGTLQLQTSLLPQNASNKSVTWSLQNGTGKASINSSGLVTSIAAGTVTAFATSADGSNITGSLTIEIKDEAHGIEQTDKKPYLLQMSRSELLILFEDDTEYNIVKLFNLQGILLLAERMVNNPCIMDISSIPRGIYIVQFLSTVRKMEVVKFYKP